MTERSPLQEGIDRLLREQSDATNLVETLWLLYAGAVNVPTGGTQWVESRRCFFAGAMTIFEAMIRIMDSDHDPTDADLRHMERLADELNRFALDLKGGTA